MGLNIESNLIYTEEYQRCIQALGIIKEEVARFEIKDFIDLDILSWHIYGDIIPREPKLEEPIEEKKETSKLPRVFIDSHEATEYYLLELGKMLGYIPYTVDQSKTFNGQKLGDVVVLNQIPAFAGERDLNSAIVACKKGYRYIYTILYTILYSRN